MRHLLPALLLTLAACAADPVLLPEAGAPTDTGQTVGDLGSDVGTDAGQPAVDLGAPTIDTPVVRVCVPGAQIGCVCVGGATGAQVCNAEGSALGVCMCPDAGVMVDAQPAADRPDTGPLPDGAVAFLPDGGCPTNYGNCDMDPATGCEVNLLTGTQRNSGSVYITDCGRCGSLNCGGGNNHSPICDEGVCRMACTAGYFDCDGNTANSCESNLTDRNNCGACGTVCRVGQRCSVPFPIRPGRCEG